MCVRIQGDEDLRRDVYRRRKNFREIMLDFKKFVYLEECFLKFHVCVCVNHMGVTVKI